MATQWYPGHMNKAREAIAEAMPSTDVVIEVLDARLPVSSANPVLTEIRGQKPCLKVLCKSDLADAETTERWIRHFAKDTSVIAIALTTLNPNEARRRVPELCKKLAPHRIGHKPVRAMIAGIPNVGKSTLINTLMERKVAAVGDKPAVTKSTQRVILKSGMMLSDNPGILWPSIEPGPTMRLALSGAMPDQAIEYENVGLFAAELFAERYPELLRARYSLASLPSTTGEVLAAIGKKRGCIRSGGIVDMHKAADALVHDFRTGKLGRISLETPEDFETRTSEPEAAQPSLDE